VPDLQSGTFYGKEVPKSWVSRREKIQNIAFCATGKFFENTGENI